MGKGGKTATQETTLPAWYNAAAQNAVETARQLSRIGYMPWTGPGVAAFSPQQIGAMGMASDLAGAYGYAAPGLQIMEPTQFEGGLMGYSSAPLYYDALEKFSQAHPEQFGRYVDYFGNPLPVGMRGDMGFSPAPEPVAAAPAPSPYQAMTDFKRNRMMSTSPEEYLHRYVWSQP